MDFFIWLFCQFDSDCCKHLLEGCLCKWKGG